MARRILLALLACACAVAAVSAQPTVRPWDGTGTNPYPQADVERASFCDRLASANGYDYSSPDHAYALMYLLVQRSYHGAVQNGSVIPPVLSDVQGLKNNQNTRDYFRGVVDYRSSPQSPYHGQPTPNIATNATAAHILDDKIARWLGGGFGCSGRLLELDANGELVAKDPSQPSFADAYPYTASRDMVAVHAGMQIGALQFTAFISQFASSALSLGATQHDFDTNVVPFLQSFARGASGSLSACNQPDCPCATGLSGAACDEAASSTATAVDPGRPPQPAGPDGAAAGLQPGGASVMLLLLLAAIAATLL